MNHRIFRKAVSLTVTALALGALLAFAPPAPAGGLYPEDGWWWSPGPSGRGYFIERQEDIMFIVSVHYSDTGEPEWLSAEGSFTASDDDGTIGSYTGTVFRSTDGQCIGCEAAAPLSVEDEQSPLNVSFSDSQHATLEWFGESVEITRSFWLWANVVDQLAGTWLLTMVEDNQPVSQFVTIEDANGRGFASITNAVSGAEDGTVELLDGDPVITLVDASESELPLVLPGKRRFYAGYRDANALQVTGVQLEDMPLVLAQVVINEEVSALEQFLDNVVVSANGNTLVLNTDDLPNHASPYWGAGNDMYEAPHDGMFVNPNRIAEQDITFRIPATPAIADSPSDTSLGPIGIAVNGVVFFNQYAGVDRVTGEFFPLENEIQSFDAYNGHPQQTGQYHYHFEPEYLTVADNAAFLGFAMDGFPIYGPRNADGSALSLDECNGEEHATPEYPDGIYHYHVTTVEPYILGCFKGTPGTVTQ
jgi:hypothetical protein